MLEKFIALRSGDWGAAEPRNRHLNCDLRRAPGGVLRTNERRWSLGAGLPKKAFVFRVPAKLASLGSRGTCTSKSRGQLRLQPEMARPSWDEPNTSLRTETPVKSDRPPSWNRGPRGRSPREPDFRLTFSGAGNTFLARRSALRR